jgi:hypothetical protein
MSDDREYVKTPIICLTCGFDGEKPVPAKNGIPKVDKCRCPQCSKTAFVHRPFRQRFIINALVKEVIRLRLDVMDLQAYAEGEDRG